MIKSEEPLHTLSQFMSNIFLMEKNDLKKPEHFPNLSAVDSVGPNARALVSFGSLAHTQWEGGPRARRSISWMRPRSLTHTHTYGCYTRSVT